MTFEEVLGMMSHVYNVPLTSAFDLPLSTIAVYASLMPSIVATFSPFGGGDEPEEVTLEELRSMLV